MNYHPHICCPEGVVKQLGAGVVTGTVTGGVYTVVVGAAVVGGVVVGA